MTKGMNWRRCGYQLGIRRYGATNIADEYEYLRNDRAARWLDARLNPKPRPPQRPATAPSSMTPPWE